MSPDLIFPYEIYDVEDKLNRQLIADFPQGNLGFVQVGPKKYLFPKTYQENAEKIYNFQARFDDVWVSSFPRSGTTCTQELVWLLANNLDFDLASKVHLTSRYSFLEHGYLFQKGTNNDDEVLHSFNAQNLDKLTQSNDRRFIKTHMPFDLLHPDLFKTGAKVIYVARNPKDVSVSMYHLNNFFKDYSGPFDKYWYYFKNGLQSWTPYWSHVEQAWLRRNEKNLLILFYEEIVQDWKKAIVSVADFLNVHYSEAEYQRLAEHMRFDIFKKNKSIALTALHNLGVANKEEEFVRSGKNGASKSYFAGNLKQDVDRWIEENSRNIGIEFPKF